MTIKNFHMSATNRQFLHAKLDQLDPTKLWLVNAIEAKKRRSIPQNRWMRGFAKHFGAYLGYTEDQMYDLIMFKFCPEFIRDPSTGAEIRMPGHFSKKQDGTDRDTKDAALIQELVLQWAAELGFIWEGEMAA